MTDQIEAFEAIEPELLPEDQVDAEAAPADEGEQTEIVDPPKPKKSAQERINEITAKAREAERERDYWRKAAISGQPAQPKPAAPAEPRDEAPHPDDYDHGISDPRYVLERAKFDAKAEIRAEFEARSQSERLTSQRTSFAGRVAEQFPDGEPEGIATLKTLPVIRSEITDVIFTSDKGPLLAEHLGDNPSVLNRLSGLPAHMVGFELAKIEAALSAPTPPSVARVTKAPDPAPKPRGTGGQFAVSPETNDFAAFERLADKVRSS